jgi:hypothetical protein
VDFLNRFRKGGIARPGRGDLKKAEDVQGSSAREYQHDAGDRNGEHQHIERGMAELRRALAERPERGLFRRRRRVDPMPGELYCEQQDHQHPGRVVRPVRGVAGGLRDVVHELAEQPREYDQQHSEPVRPLHDGSVTIRRIAPLHDHLPHETRGAPVLSAPAAKFSQVGSLHVECGRYLAYSFSNIIDSCC